MTYLEKLKQDNPDWDDDAIRTYAETECPGPYFCSSDCPDGYVPLTDCHACWTNEIPETETNEREEKNMENTTPATYSTRKTKAELLEEIAALKKQVEHLDRYKKYEECANEMAAMRDSFVTAGFTRDEAFAMTKVMIENAVKMAQI